MNLEALARKNVLSLSPYRSARDEFDQRADIYLDANENPFDNGYNRYPDPYHHALKKRLSEIKHVPPDHILLGNGSDEVLDLIVRAFCEPGQENMVTHRPGYGMYAVLSALNNVTLRAVGLESGFRLRAQSLLAAADEQTKLFIVCSPNNPSGNLLNKKEIKALLQAARGMVVIDEAYIDFAPDGASWLGALQDYPHLIVCQTLSKAWGMAGLRVGLCFAHPEIIALLHRIKPPYNLNALSQQAALKALNHEHAFASQVQQIIEERMKMQAALAHLACIDEVFPSQANFLLARVRHAQDLYHYLLKKNIVVRNRTHDYLCHNCLRLTIGTPQENQTLLAALQAYALGETATTIPQGFT